MDPYGRKRRTPSQTQTKPGIDFNLCRKRGGLFLDARLHWLKTGSPEEGIKRAEKNLLTTFNKLRTCPKTYFLIILKRMIAHESFKKAI
ncbi:hypothetical protein QMM92_04405 [Leptospira santarosai]|nr:hypothetical protein [Leptospira santarosai]MDI7223976.1 hypothetical protein [Leptospira santarosai]